jgi:hypothetical protein
VKYVEEVRLDLAVPAEFVRAFLLDITNWADLQPAQTGASAKSVKPPAYAWEGDPWNPGSAITATSGPRLFRVTARQTVLPSVSGELYRVHGKVLGIEALTTCHVEALSDVSCRLVRITTGEGWAASLANRLPAAMEEQRQRTVAKIRATIEGAWLDVSRPDRRM